MDSEKIKAILKDFRITLPVGIILGLIIGLVIGWGLWPVQWTDLDVYHLRSDLREDYLRMAIFTSDLTGDASIVTKAWNGLEDTAEDTLEAVRNDMRFLTPEQVGKAMVTLGETSPQATDVTEPTPQTDDKVENTGPNWLLLAGLCLVVILAAGVIVYFFVIRTRPLDEEQPQSLASHRPAAYDDTYPEDDMADSEAGFAPGLSMTESSEPVDQFMTTYMMGDDMYDDSFSIDAPTGEFLGECGVGISDTVGVGEPKRVSAFEVWLFDKNDIQTVTKVIMSEHAYEDNKIRMRLESKGEPILIEAGKQILLETATLQLEARIVDLEYGEGAAPDLSYFQRLTMELTIWQKTRASL